MKTSVIIPVYQQEPYVKEALLSVLAQREEVEVVIVDDCSPYRAVLDRDLGLFSGCDFIRVVRPERNLGLAGARNFGIEHSSGEFILPLDADDMIAPFALQRMLRAIDGADVAYGWMQRFGERHERWVQPSGWSIAGLISENRLPYCSLFRRSMWEKVGGYDQSMGRGYEDWDLWIRMALAGAKFVYINAAALLYRRHGESMIDRAMQEHGQIVDYMDKKYRKILGITKDEIDVSTRRRLELPVSFEEGCAWR